MSKVESNDEMRIREMQEAQRRAEVRSKEASRAQQREKSFDEALKSRRSHASTRAENTDRKRERAAARGAIEQVRQGEPRSQLEWARRAALHKAFFGQKAQGGRVRAAIENEQVLSDRAEGSLEARGEEHARVEETGHDEEVREVERVLERQEELRQEAVRAELAHQVDRDGRRRQDGQESDGEEREQAQIQGVGAKKAGGAAGAPAPVPPELLKRIVGTLMKVIEDGRTRLRVRLQGRGLEGVELEVRHENGQVACDFSGCNDRLRRDLENARGALSQALEKKGLKLARLTAR